jgi:hypothetical protein
VALVDVGAVGGDATEDVLGDRYRRHFAAGALTLCWLTPLITSCKVLGQPSRPEFSGWRGPVGWLSAYPLLPLLFRNPSDQACRNFTRAVSCDGA